MNEFIHFSLFIFSLLTLKYICKFPFSSFTVYFTVSVFYCTSQIAYNPLVRLPIPLVRLPIYLLFYN